MLRLILVLTCLGCLIGLLNGQQVLKVQLSSCRNDTFELRCNDTTTMIVVVSAVHSVADRLSCPNCSPSCLGGGYDYSYDHSYDYDYSYSYHGRRGSYHGRRGSYHGRRRRRHLYQGPLGRLCDGRNVCTLQRWCGEDCVETFDISYQCVARDAGVTQPTSGSTVTPSTSGGTGSGTSSGSLPGFELQQATLSTCKNQTFELRCPTNSSLVISSARHWLAEVWYCGQCGAGCMADDRARRYYDSHYHGYPRSDHIARRCNGRNQCTIDRWCQTECVESHDVKYYCIDSSKNVQTTCLLPRSSAPDLVLLQKCPVRVDPSMRPGGSSSGGTVVTVVSPYRPGGGYSVCRRTDGVCRQVFSRNHTTDQGGFTLIPHGYSPILLRLEYQGGVGQTASPANPSSPNVGSAASISPITSKSGGAAGQTTVKTGFGSGNTVGGTVQTKPRVDQDGESPQSNVSGSRQDGGPGTVGVMSSGSLNVIIIVVVVVMVLAIIGIAVLVVALQKRKRYKEPPPYLRREPVIHNIYLSDSSDRSSTGTEGTDWMTPEQLENQRNMAAPPHYDPNPRPSAPPSY